VFQHLRFPSTRDLLSRNLRALSARLADKTTLFEALTEAAGKKKDLEDDVIRDIAVERLISPAVVLGTGSCTRSSSRLGEADSGSSISPKHRSLNPTNGTSPSF